MKNSRIFEIIKSNYQIEQAFNSVVQPHVMSSFMREKRKRKEEEKGESV